MYTFPKVIVTVNGYLYTVTLGLRSKDKIAHTVMLRTERDDRN